MKKYFPTILTSLVLIFGVGILVAHAQSYTPLAPLPGTVDTAGNTDITTYLAGALKLIIALGGALAIFMAILAGTKYVAAGISPDAKSNAKSDMTNAFIGLALILSSYLILNSINPNLVALNFSLTPINVAPAAPTVVNSWESDTSERYTLGQYGVKVKDPTCTTIDQQGCTSVAGLKTIAMNGLRDLYKACDDWKTFGSCDVVITGGTEYWLHRSHNDGTKIDLRATTDLSEYLKQNQPIYNVPCGVSTDGHYSISGIPGVYVYEPNRDAQGVIVGSEHHWHVCYY